MKPAIAPSAAVSAKDMSEILGSIRKPELGRPNSYQNRRLVRGPPRHRSGSVQVRPASSARDAYRGAGHDRRPRLRPGLADRPAHELDRPSRRLRGLRDHGPRRAAPRRRRADHALRGALAAGAIAGAAPGPLRPSAADRAWRATSCWPLAGTLGYLLGSLVGWAIGRWGGRPLLERHGRWLHLTPENLDRAERWFDRHGAGRGLPRAPHAGRALLHLDPGRRRSRARSAPTPCSRWPGRPSGASASPPSAGRWASSYEQVHHAFRYVDVLAVAGAVAALAAVLVLHRRRARA